MEQAAKEGGEPPAVADSAAAQDHATIAKVTDDIGRRFPLNTPIAALFELVNEIYRVKAPGHPAARFAAETAVPR